jgi:hypothetical protein
MISECAFAAILLLVNELRASIPRANSNAAAARADPAKSFGNFANSSRVADSTDIRAVG